VKKFNRSKKEPLSLSGEGQIHAAKIGGSQMPESTCPTSAERRRQPVNISIKPEDSLFGSSKFESAPATRNQRLFWRHEFAPHPDMAQPPFPAPEFFHSFGKDEGGGDSAHFPGLSTPPLTPTLSRKGEGGPGGDDSNGLGFLKFTEYLLERGDDLPHGRPRLHRREEGREDILPFFRGLAKGGKGFPTFRESLLSFTAFSLEIWASRIFGLARYTSMGFSSSLEVKRLTPTRTFSPREILS